MKAVRISLCLMCVLHATVTIADLRAGASRHTQSLQNQVRAQLPFSDQRDLEEARRGFLAAPVGNEIIEDRHPDRYAFLGASSDTIHPSLQRQAQLNAVSGLYEVVPDAIYQIRGFGLANMTLVRGRTGWIVFDTLLTTEAARAAKRLADRVLGELPIRAVIYSHSHVDHFGGVRGIVSQQDVDNGRVQILAPDGFMDHVVAENVYAGNAMARRITYQYGTDLSVDERGYVDSGIGKAGERGTLSLIAPTDVIREAFAEREIDGIRILFQNTPGTEAPAEMNAYLPEHRTFWGAENINATIHNVYTLRGALVRDALAWSRHINESLYRYGQEAEVMVTSHNWPRWGNARIQEVLRAQRDSYANLNNQSLRLANQGVTINQIHNEYQVPQSLAAQWPARQYHGSEFHNSRAVVNRYLGYWDGNPATLAPLSPEQSAGLYVEMMGGAEPIMKRSRALFDEGKYRHASELLNKLIYAEPDNQPARHLLANVFEQLGYQYESASMRHAHLAAALELREGVKGSPVLNTRSPDLLRAISTLQWCEATAIRVDSAKAEGLRWTINMTTPDNGERFVIEMSGTTLTCLQGYSAEEPDLEIEIDRAQLLSVISGRTSLLDEAQRGRARLQGDKGVLQQLAETLVTFDTSFEILPGTRASE